MVKLIAYTKFSKETVTFTEYNELKVKEHIQRLKNDTHVEKIVLDEEIIWVKGGK